jgi:hypothetical protein
MTASHTKAFCRQPSQGERTEKGGSRELCSRELWLGLSNKHKCPGSTLALWPQKRQMSLTPQIPYRGRPGRDTACLGSLDRTQTAGRLQEALPGYLVENFR